MQETPTEGKVVAYLRVSTDRQDLKYQRHAILEYANRHKLHVDDWCEVEMSPVAQNGQGVSRNCIDPLVYLEDALRRINGHTASRVAELLPDNWKQAREARA